MKFKATILTIILTLGMVTFPAVNPVAADDTDIPYFYLGLTDIEQAAYDTLKVGVAENLDTVQIAVGTEVTERTTAAETAATETTAVETTTAETAAETTAADETAADTTTAETDGTAAAETAVTSITELTDMSAADDITAAVTAENSPLTADSMNRIIGVLLYYDPEHFNISTITADADSQTFTVTYRYDKDRYAKMKASAEKRVNDIVALANTRAAVYNKLITIHDEIIKNCRFDETAPEKSSIYGALVDRKADSYGYAKAFCYIAGKAGIRSFVNIYTSGNVTLARSTVYIDSFWYNIDCAKDDTSRFAENESYAYFMVPDSVYSGSVPYSAYFVSPAAVAVNNYYYKALKLEAADDVSARELIIDLVAKNSKTKKSTIRFSFSDLAAFDNFKKTVTETSFLTDTLETAAKSTSVPIITDAADISFNRKTRVVTILIYYPDTLFYAYYTDASGFSEEQLLYLKSIGLR